MKRAEIHFHLLPGVDDGPRTLAESVDLARAAVADGTDTVVATPHVGDVRLPELPGRLDSLRAGLKAAEVPLEVIGGGELAPRDVGPLSDEELASIAVGPPGRRWALLEAPTHSASAEDVNEAAEALRARGLGVVIGHPERCPALLADDGREAIERELVRGSLLQISAPSLLGVYGGAVRSMAERLVVEVPEVCVVASDAHSAERPPLLSDALAAVAGLAGEDVARELVDRRPRRLVHEGWEAKSEPGLPATEAVC